jgi:hypothetical protein
MFVIFSFFSVVFVIKMLDLLSRSAYVGAASALVQFIVCIFQQGCVECHPLLYEILTVSNMYMLSWAVTSPEDQHRILY